MASLQVFFLSLRRNIVSSKFSVIWSSTLEGFVCCRYETN